MVISQAADLPRVVLVQSRNPAVMLMDVKGRVLCVSDSACYGGGTDWRTESSEFEGYAYFRNGGLFFFLMTFISQTFL